MKTADKNPASRVARLPTADHFSLGEGPGHDHEDFGVL